MEHGGLTVVLILAIGLSLASLLAYIAHRLRLPVIIGYLIAGYMIGPFSPGFVADLTVSEELAEVGVILMLFGVGLHFKVADLLKVKSIAIPGAVFQTLAATVATIGVITLLDGPLSTGIIIGLAIGVASTVVLVRVLNDNHLINTKEGHIAIGWLIVEDIFTIIILIMLPTFASSLTQTEISLLTISWDLMLTLIKFAIPTIVMFTIGHNIINYILINVVRLRSPELFTLTLVAIMFLIATGSTILFGTSIALGAFIAGMVIGKTTVRHQAAANALPLKDVFAVIFFLSVGMLFNPIAIITNFPLFIGILSIVLIVKPLSAYLITIFLKQTTKVALTVAIALAQIGEFTFILSEAALNLKLIPDEGFDILVAVALVSISLNPILFQILGNLEKSLTIFSNPSYTPLPDTITHPIVIIGCGPIGKHIAHIACSNGYTPTIIENNIDTVNNLEDPYNILFGNAINESILEEAHIAKAEHLFITIPDTEATLTIIDTARRINPTIDIVARIRYIREEKIMDALHVRHICSEKEALREFSTLIPTILTKVD